jgi:hypothetical protein
MKRFAIVVVLPWLSLAQTSKPPEVYSATEINGMMGAPVTMKIDRDGAKAVVEQTSGTIHLRTFYDLEKHQSYSMDLNQPASGCGSGNFSGDWGDPFEMSAGLMKDLTKQTPTQLGSETMNGFATKVIEAPAGAQKVKVWIDNTYGLIIKAQIGAQTLLEIKQLSLARPAASLLAMPAACASAPPPPAPKATSADLVDAMMPPRTPDNGCSVLFRVVRAGSMQPITSGFQVAIDTNVDLEHMASYSTSQAANGQARFSGGAVREVTAQLRNGVLRVDNAPKYFQIDAWFGKAGDASALIYRNCASAQTVLLLVVKNPAVLSEGADWMWAKSGKYATVN